MKWLLWTSAGSSLRGCRWMWTPGINQAGHDLTETFMKTQFHTMATVSLSLSLSLRCRGCLFTKPSFHTSLENKRDKQCYWCNCFCELHWSRSSIWAGEYLLYLMVYKQLCGALIVYCINLLRCRLRFSDSKKEKMLHFTKFMSNRTISEEYSVCCAVLHFTSLII